MYLRIHLLYYLPEYQLNKICEMLMTDLAIHFFTEFNGDRGTVICERWETTTLMALTNNLGNHAPSKK